MMVIIILFNNKDYNNRTPPPLQEKIVFPKGHRWKEMRFLKENCSFLNFGMECPEVFKAVKHVTSIYSAGYTTFCLSPVG